MTESAINKRILQLEQLFNSRHPPIIYWLNSDDEPNNKIMTLVDECEFILEKIEWYKTFLRAECKLTIKHEK